MFDELEVADDADRKKGAKMKSGRKLKDYPPIPSTPPPSEKRDKGLVCLEHELEHERKYLCSLCTENKELEEMLLNFDKEIAYVKSNFPEQIVGDKKLHASNEYWFKYEAQMELIRKLQREKKSLESEIRQIEEHGMINLDALSQSELIMYVKQLERMKTNLLSDLRSKEWGLDKQARDIHHLNEMKRALQAEIRHYDKEFSMFRHYKRNACPSASPTERRNSSGAEEKRFRMWKLREKSKSEEPPEKVHSEKESSQSQEDVAAGSKSDLMFSSLDEAKLERMDLESPTPSFARRILRGSFTERKKNPAVKKTPVRKTVAVGSLPELSKSKSKTPSPRALKTKRAKPENKVGTELAPQEKLRSKSPSKPIQIIVTYETQRTVVGESKAAEGSMTTPETPTGTGTTTETATTSNPSGSEEEKKYCESFRSIEEVYEEDFESGSGEDGLDGGKKVGFLTTRV